MLMEKERLEIIKYGIKLSQAKLTKGTSGNLSIFNRKKGLMAITPSGIDYSQIRAEDIGILDLKGKQVDGDKKPSSEYEMHRIFYEKRRDIDAIIHSHTIFATTIACLNWNLPAVHYMIGLAGKDVLCASYARYGTEELALNAYEAMLDRRAVLLANHGLLVGAENLENAFNITEEVEYCAELYYRAKSIGEPVILSDDEMLGIIENFSDYGQRGGEENV